MFCALVELIDKEGEEQREEERERETECDCQSLPNNCGFAIVECFEILVVFLVEVVEELQMISSFCLAAPLRVEEPFSN